MNDMICFYKVSSLDLVKKFYEDILELKLYKDQRSCLIYETEQHHKIGFCECESQKVICDSVITFVYETKDEVDQMYHLMKHHLLTPIHYGLNEFYHIYHFFITDFNGLKVEFQTFI